MTFKMPPFAPRFPWWGAVLQTFATSLMRPPAAFEPGETEQRIFALNDGSGDRMIGMLDRPRQRNSGLPLVVLLHGMPGDADSRYMIRVSRYLLDCGYRVLRMNLRGAGPSLETCSHHYSAAKSRDLQELFAVMPYDLTEDGIVAVGFSLGGAILLKYLGEQGRRHLATPLKAACAISAPLDLLGTCREVMNPLYHRVLFPLMKRTTLRAKMTDLERAKVEAATTIWELDDSYAGPHHGFKNATDYYAASSAAQFLNDIEVPTLIVAALDDPWVPGGAYLTHLWRRNPNLTPLLTESGGHVGFHGKGNSQPWCDIAIARFLDSTSGRVSAGNRLYSRIYVS